MGGTNTCIHTRVHFNSASLWHTRPTGQRVLVSPIILIVNTMTWYVQKTSRTVSLSHPHLITFNVCVWRTTKAWISLPRLPAHLQHHQGKEANFGESCLSSFLLPLPLRLYTCHICPLPRPEVCDKKRSSQFN